MLCRKLICSEVIKNIDQPVPQTDFAWIEHMSRDMHDPMMKRLHFERYKSPEDPDEDARKKKKEKMAQYKKKLERVKKVQFNAQAKVLNYNE